MLVRIGSHKAGNYSERNVGRERNHLDCGTASGMIRANRRGGRLHELDILKTFGTGLLSVLRCMLRTIFIGLLVACPLPAQELSLQSVVTPSTIIVKDGHPIKFAIHGF